MNDVAWVVGFYPAVISIYAILCQSQLHVPKDTLCLPSSTQFEVERKSIATNKVRIITQEQKDVSDYSIRFESENQKPLPIVRSRSSIWIAAFWFTLQSYCLIRMGSKVGPAEQQQTGFVWLAMIFLCIPTILHILSVGKLYEALENIETYQRSSIEPKQEYFISAFGVAVTLLLGLIPWIQVVLVLIRS